MTAFIFPGQGSQTVEMGKPICDSFAEARAVFEQASDAAGEDIASLCFSSDEKTLSLTANAQPAILTVSIAVLRALEARANLSPDFAAGHSLGEYSALVAAGAIDFSDAVKIVRKRGEFMQQAVAEGQGAMAAVIGLKKTDIEKICENCSETGSVVSPANYNSPEQTVISGHTGAVRKASQLASESGARRVVPLKVSAPFHCALMSPAADKLAETLDGIKISPFKFPVVTNFEATENSEPERVRDLLLAQITAPVRWSESVEHMKKRGARRFIEIGPGKTLCGLIKKTVEGAETLNLEMPEHLNNI